MIVAVKFDLSTITAGDIAAIVAGLAALGLAYLTLQYVFATRAMVTEMREARIAQTRPYMVLDIENTRHTLCDMVIKNIGNSAALDVQIDFEPEQMYYDTGQPLSELPIFSQMKFVVPGREYRFFFKQLVGENIDPKSEGFQANVKYSDASGARYSETITLNPWLRWNLLLIEEKGMTELVKAVEEIPKEIQRTSKSIGELEATFRRETRAFSPTYPNGPLRRGLFVKLAEVREFWRALFRADVKDGGLYHSPLLFQARFHRLATDLVALADAWTPEEGDAYPRVDRSFVGGLAEALLDMSAMRLYGDASLKSFQERGDGIVLSIDEALGDPAL